MAICANHLINMYSAQIFALFEGKTRDLRKCLIHTNGTESHGWLHTDPSNGKKNVVKTTEAVGAHMLVVFRSLDLFIDWEMGRSNRLFSIVEKICRIGGENSPRIGRLLSTKIAFGSD